VFGTEIVGKSRDAFGKAQRHRKSLATEKILIVVEPVYLVVGIQRIGAIDGHIGCFREKARRLADVGQAEERPAYVAAFNRQGFDVFFAQLRSYFRIEGVD